MFKKLAIAAALAASTSFAAWDLYPVLDQHKGEIGVGVGYSADNYTSSLTGSIGVRYSVIQNLELGLVLPYRFFTHYDGHDMNADGLGALRFMARYQITPTINVFTDVGFPTADESYYAKDVWSVAAGAQYSNSINSFIRFGSEIGISTNFIGSADITSMFLNANTEFEFNVTPQFTPYVGANIGVFLGYFADDGYRYNSVGGGDIDTRIYVGAKYAFNDMFEVGAYAGIWFGNGSYKDNTEKDFGAYGSFKF